MGVGKDGQPKDSFTRGMELRGKYTLFGEGARGSLTKQLTAKFGLDKGREPQKYGIGLKELWQVKPEQAPAGSRPAFVRLAARQRHRRRLIPLSLWREPGVGRLRRASQLQEPLPVALRGIPALQDAPSDRADVRRGQAHRLRRPRHHRGRLAVDPGTGVPRRRVARLRCGLCQRAAHQGLAQRDPVRHPRRRGGVRCGRRRSGAGYASTPTRRPS